MLAKCSAYRSPTIIYRIEKNIRSKTIFIEGIMEALMKTADINLRDPFVMPHNGKYYLYGSRVGVQTGFDVYVSEDLENWRKSGSVFEYKAGFFGTCCFWAPEVHPYNGRFYMFATFGSQDRHRGTAVLVSDSPEGPFTEYSDGPVTPNDWECLDGTLYVSHEGKPYMVFCHEWTQIGDGEICAVELSEDLRTAVSEPKVLWKASDAQWVANICREEDRLGLVTDGPWVMRVGAELICLWSSYDKNGYVEAVSRSHDGTVMGNWTVDQKILFGGDGGHGMVFETFKGTYKFVCHMPNTHLLERPNFRDITLKDLARS